VVLLPVPQDQLGVVQHAAILEKDGSGNATITSTYYSNNYQVKF
jgi:hypothetical protein